MILFEDRAATILYKVLSKIQDKKKFLLPLNICPIVPDTFVKANMPFKFIDISLDTLCMDEKEVLHTIKNDVSIGGILFVKTFGIEIKSNNLYKKIKSINKDIFIIDDMCPCIQDFEYDIENSYADMALFSSGYSKYVDIGYGGFAFLKDEKFKNIFEDKSNNRGFLEYKDKIKEKIPVIKNHKESLNNIYNTNLPSKILLGEKFNNWRFSILVDNKHEILDSIFKLDGLFASSHYPQVDYKYTLTPQKNSNTNIIHNKIINLFNDFRFTKEKAYKTIEIINKNYRGNR